LKTQRSQSDRIPPRSGPTSRTSQTSTRSGRLYAFREAPNAPISLDGVFSQSGNGESVGLVEPAGGVHDQSEKDRPALGNSDGNELARHPDQGCKRIRFHLSHNVPAVKLNSAFCDSQFKRGLLI
jgi:hypothetical protein